MTTETEVDKGGRPSTYTDEVAQTICQRLASGETLRSICRGEDMPAESTVRTWALDDREGFADQYERARMLQAHTIFDETIEIADDNSRDISRDADGVESVNHDHIARSRLRVDTRKFYLSKVLPKIYGEKVTNVHTDPDGGPVTVRWQLPGEKV